jgi:hypothetical protein
MMSEPILIGVGSTEGQMLAAQVLAYTLHKHSRRKLEVIPLHRAGVRIPVPKDPANAPRTPYSFQRFLLPQLGRFERRSIYLEADMLVFADIGRLYDIEMDDTDVLTTETPSGQPVVYGVLLIGRQCPWRIADLVARLDSGEASYEPMMRTLDLPRRVEHRLPYHWNSMERFEPGVTSLLHYIDVHRQPWLTRDNPLAEIWVQALLEAIDAGFVARDFVITCVARRWVRPSLAHQVEQRVADPNAIPPWIALEDRSFLRHCKQRKWQVF